jgi:transposase
LVEASALPQALEKSLAPEGLLAHSVVSKYVDHLPLYRLERIFLRQGVDLSRTTVCGWVADIATALVPIGDELPRQVTAAPYLQTDDTPVTVLEHCAPFHVTAHVRGATHQTLNRVGRGERAAQPIRECERLVTFGRVFRRSI